MRVSHAFSTVSSHAIRPVSRKVRDPTGGPRARVPSSPPAPSHLCPFSRPRLLAAGLRLLLPHEPLRRDDPGPAVLAAVEAAGPVLALALARRPAAVPLAVREEVVQPEGQEREAVALEVGRVGGPEVDGGRDAADHRRLVRVDERPGAGEAGAPPPVEQPHPGDDEEVVRPRVAELVPPVLAEHLALVDLVQRPEVPVAVLVQEDGLEDVLLQRQLRRELRLVVGAVEAHLQLREVLGVHLDHVHGLVRLLRELHPRRLVLAGERGYRLLLVVEHLVVLLHVLVVTVRDGDVVGKFCGPQHLSLSPG